MFSQDDIEEVKESNSKTKSLYDVWPLIFFIIGLFIAALFFTNTLG